MTDTADDFIKELGRTVKLVVAKEVGPLREALAIVGAENAELRQRLEASEAALAEVQGRDAIDEAVKSFVDAAADDLRAEWAARDAERAADGDEAAPEWLTAESLVGALEPLRRSLEALPPPPDLSEFTTKDDVAGMLDFLQRDLAETLLPRDWSPEIEAVRQAIPPPPDVSGFVNRSEVEAIRGLVATQTAEIRAEFHAAIKAVELTPGPEGRLPLARAWDDDVTYSGEVRTHAGSTWQAQRDTGKPPGGDDWICLAGRGEDGEDGKAAPRFRIRGTYAEGWYEELDIVALNGASFVALRDDPGPCPGDGWQLWARQGKPGDKSREPGPPGKNAPKPIGFRVDPEAVALTLEYEGGLELTADLYPLLEQVAK